jgi:hypothetical protein
MHAACPKISRERRERNQTKPNLNESATKACIKLSLMREMGGEREVCRERI